jgi:hypothetical protein
MNPFGQLPIWLYGIGMALIFSGIVWAQLTRRAHSLRVSTSVAEQTADLTGVRNEPGSGELEDDFRGISSFGKLDRDKRKGLVARRGVGAIFSSDQDWSTGEREGSRVRWISTTMLLNVVGWGMFLVVYALLVQEYTSNAYMQSYVRTKLGFGAYLLDNYTLLVVATLLGFLLFRMLFLNWRHAKTRRFPESSQD